MRGLRGWIRNLSDGLGPPAGTVDVHATYQGDNAELDNTTHQTGVLQRVHVLGGSGSNTKADPFGHFGWNMELSPGQIKQAITPTDPQTEYRFRYPDESAQIGKAYHTDLERLAWTAGRDGIVWNAINAGNDPASAAGWSNDPTSTLSWGVGNGSIASFGPTAGKITIRPFIAFVGGAVFSVEMADLEAAATGGGAALRDVPRRGAAEQGRAPGLARRAQEERADGLPAGGGAEAHADEQRHGSDRGGEGVVRTVVQGRRPCELTLPALPSWFSNHRETLNEDARCGGLEGRRTSDD